MTDKCNVQPQVTPVPGVLEFQNKTCFYKWQNNHPCERSTTTETEALEQSKMDFGPPKSLMALLLKGTSGIDFQSIILFEIDKT